MTASKVGDNEPFKSGEATQTHPPPLQQLATRCRERTRNPETILKYKPRKGLWKQVWGNIRIVKYNIARVSTYRVFYQCVPYTQHNPQIVNRIS
jgi:hypothetical protein